MRDDGVGLAGPVEGPGRGTGSGLGLAPMRQRAEKIGGTLETGPGDHGCGTVVRALLPLTTAGAAR